MYYSLISSMSKGTSSFDSDALAFISAASITDTTQKNAVNQLVLDLKSANIWTKMKALYPFVGGTAPQHRFNLKSPGTTTGDYYIDFIGGVTHASNGVTFNGTTGYADTKLYANTLLLNSTHVSASLVSNGGGAYIGCMMGANASSRLWLAPSFNASIAYFLCNNSVVATSTRSTNIGLWVLSRTTSTNEIAYNNGSVYLNKTANSTALDTGIIYIGARNNGTNITNYMNAPLNFSSIGDGLTATDVTNLTNAVNTFNTTIGR